MATTTGARRAARSSDEEVEARLAWLASAPTEEEAHLIESALLARTDNGPQPGDPEQENRP